GGTRNGMSGSNGGAGSGQVRRLTFDGTGGRNEGSLSGYDWGGGDFINDNGVWKLAGVNFAAKGPYSLTGAAGSGFNASIFDEGAVYVGRDSYRWYQPRGGRDVSGGGSLGGGVGDGGVQREVSGEACV